MADDRTREPSKRRRQEARERGQAVHSPELTGAAGFLAASAALAVWGDGLAARLVALVRRPLTDAPVLSADVLEVVSRFRAETLGVAGPLGAILFAFAAAAFAAHQGQVLGLFAPGLLAPDPRRLWKLGQDPGLGSRATRGLWVLAKATIVVAAAAWVLRADWLDLQRLGGMSVASIARAAGASLGHVTLVLAAATLALGLVDFWLQHRRFDAMLRLTPEEQREDLRAMEGDPALRAQRRRIARSWRGDSPELLAGASLVLTGPAGLTVVLAGGPPPRRVLVRSIVSGPPGERLRQAAGTSGVTMVSAPALARRFAERRPPSLPPTPELVADLVSLWNPAR